MIYANVADGKEKQMEKSYIEPQREQHTPYGKDDEILPNSTLPLEEFWKIETK